MPILILFKIRDINLQLKITSMLPNKSLSTHTIKSKTKLLFYITVVVLFFNLISGCKKTEDFSPYNLNAALKLSISDSVLVLNEANKYNTALTFNWTTGSNKGTGSSIYYTLQIDKQGNNFSSPVKTGLGAAVYSSSYSVDVLNTLLLNYFAATAGSAANLEVRIVDSVSGNMVKNDTSNVIKLRFTPYTPVSKTLYIIGDATATGWDTNKSAPLTLDATTPGLFTYQATLYPGKFKFITTLGSFLPSYNMGSDSTHIILRKSNSDPDNQFTIYTTGVYNISVNLITLQVSYTPVSAPAYSQLWIVGDATPNGWNINSPNQMTIDVFNPYIFHYYEKLNVGEFKMPTSTGNWGADYYRPLTNDPPITDTTAALVLGSTNPPDNKWKITTAGAYKISLNILSNSIHITPFTPYTALWLLGDAAPNGWNDDDPTPMTATADPNVFVYEGPLTAGEFKIPVAIKNGFAGPYFRPDINHPAITDTNAPFVTIGSGAADSKDYKWQITTAGTYKITVNQLYETISIVKE